VSEISDVVEGDTRDDQGTGRPQRRTALVAAVIVGVVLVLLVGVLATRDPATDRQADSPLIGRAAPAITEDALDGEPFDLDALRGRWVVVNFFATWCVPCRVEHPELVRFAEAHPDDAAVVSVVFDDEPGDVQAFFEQNGGEWPVVPGEGTGVILDYAVSGIPESFLVAPNGVVVAKVTGGVTATGLDQIIAEVQERAT